MSVARRVAPLALVAILGSIGAASPASAATERASRKAAFVVVDTGVRVARVRIEFVTTVDGYQALGLAGGETIRSGDTVCQILGVGPDHDQCTAGAPSSWSYFRAKSGSARWRAMAASPTTVRVHDGDVEGWRFRSSNPPRVNPDKARRVKAGAGS